MSDGGDKARRFTMLLVTISLCAVSVLAAIATGAGVYVYAAFAAENRGKIAFIWLAWMMAGFAISVANAVWSAKLLKAPTARGMSPVVVTSCLALLSFAFLKATTT